MSELVQDPAQPGSQGDATAWLLRFERSASGAGGAFSTLSAGADGRLGLVTSSRRAPLDAPSTASAGGVGVAIWGDLDNAADLRRQSGVELAARPHGRPGGQGGDGQPLEGDHAELVLAAYRRHGPALPTALKGRHVVVVYDAARDLLLAARDRVGIVPLFRREDGESLEFAVDVAAFHRVRGERPVVNTALAAAYLAHLRMNVEETFVAGVTRVPPGHVFVLDRGEQRLKRHWLPPPVGAGAEWVREPEVGRFGELLDAAVSRPLARGRGGVFLSGGLDSVSVAAAAVDHSRRHGLEPPVALSLLFPQAVSEEEVQRGVARSLGLDLVALGFDEALGGRGLLRSGLELSARLGAPLQNVWTPAYDALTAAGRERGVTNVLTGGGGDEWLTVTPLIAADYLARGEIAALFSYLGALTRSLNLRPHQLWRSVVWTNGAKPLLYAAAARARARYRPRALLERRRRELSARIAAIPAWVAPGELREALVERLRAQYEGPLEPAPLGPGGRYFREMKVTLNHPLFALDVEEIFEDGQRNRAPHWDIYWDADLIEFLYRVPPKLLNQGGRSKGLVRADVARRFPDFGFATQRKLVSRDFFTERFYAELGDAWGTLGGPEALATTGIVDKMSVGDLFGEALDVRSAAKVDSIWRLMSLEAWVRTHS